MVYWLKNYLNNFDKNFKKLFLKIIGRFREQFELSDTEHFFNP
jgi:hypothetical protein